MEARVSRRPSHLRRRTPILASAVRVAAMCLAAVGSGCQGSERHLAATEWRGHDAAVEDAQASLFEVSKDRPPTSTPDGAACGTTFVDLTSPPANIVLLAERSTLMTTAPTDLCAGCANLWDALLGAADDLTGSSSNRFRWGLKLFPSPGGGNACFTSPTLEVFPIEGANRIIVAALNSAPPAGEAPATAALRQAASILVAMGFDIPTVYVLMLGGNPTCAGSDNAQEDSTGLVAEIEKRSARVFVVGLGPKHAAWDRIAAAGGTLSAYAPSEIPNLLSALERLAAATAGCTFTLQTAARSGASVPSLEVLLDGQSVPPSALDGFTVSSDGTRLTLNGSFCSGLGGYSTLRIQVGCR